ncbi:hypothetical protein HDU97_009786 [Phlyctochytrium planicorne]|nr:hypothetical protein HDU97_009786 [Phlyctochytrium planicorne]
MKKSHLFTSYRNQKEVLDCSGSKTVEKFIFDERNSRDEPASPSKAQPFITPSRGVLSKQLQRTLTVEEDVDWNEFLAGPLETPTSKLSRKLFTEFCSRTIAQPKRLTKPKANHELRVLTVREDEVEPPYHRNAFEYAERPRSLLSDFHIDITGRRRSSIGDVRRSSSNFESRSRQSQSSDLNIDEDGFIRPNYDPKFTTFTSPETASGNENGENARPSDYVSPKKHDRAAKEKSSRILAPLSIDDNIYQIIDEEALFSFKKARLAAIVVSFTSLVSHLLQQTNDMAETVAKKPQKDLYLKGADNIFLAIEDEHHLMTVSSIYTFEKHVDPAQIRSQVNDFAQHTVCCYRVMEPGKGFFGRNKWREVPLNIDNHFRVVKLPSPGNKSQLAAALSEEVSAKFDFSKPLWDTVFYEGLEDGGCVLFLKAHHCIADGQGFVRNLLSYVASLDPTKDRSSLQYTAGRNMVTPPATPTQPTKAEEAAQKPLKPVKSKPAAKSPVEMLTGLMTAIFLSIHFTLVYILNFLHFITSHKRSFTRASRTANKQVGWSSNVSLDDVKLIKNTFGVTVNDVLTGTLAAAIEGYLSDRGGVKDPDGFWFFIPTSLRHPDDWSVSNKSSGYVLNVPLANGDAVAGIRRFNKRMKAKKGNPEPIFNFVSMDAGYTFPQFVPKLAKTIGFNKIHAVVTNVPGPSEPLPWAGHPIKEIISFIPQAYPNSLGCAIYTYRNQVSLSVMIDKDDNDLLFATGAAQAIVEEFESIFAELLVAAKNAGSVGANGEVKQKAS